METWLIVSIALYCLMAGFTIEYLFESEDVPAFIAIVAGLLWPLTLLFVAIALGAEAIRNR